MWKWGDLGAIFIKKLFWIIIEVNDHKNVLKSKKETFDLTGIQTHDFNFKESEIN